MDIKQLRRTWSGMRAEIRIHQFVTPMALSLALLTTIGWMSSKEVAVLVPPNLDETVRVSQSSADGGYKKAWGVYAATLMGNITPSNAEFIAGTLENIMSPRVYQAIRESLAQQVDRIKRDGLSVAFNPRSVNYEVETGKVFIDGWLQLTGSSGETKRTQRVYEYEFDIRAGSPVITYFDTYSGKPKTKTVMQRLDAAERRREEAAQEQREGQ
ncbi:MAG: TraE/TraK family type IV conjugative transfer system protein [Salinisphaeraceae bacterium]